MVCAFIFAVCLALASGQALHVEHPSVCRRHSNCLALPNQKGDQKHQVPRDSKTKALQHAPTQAPKWIQVAQRIGSKHCPKPIVPTKRLNKGPQNEPQPEKIWFQLYHSLAVYVAKECAKKNTCNWMRLVCLRSAAVCCSDTACVFHIFTMNIQPRRPRIKYRMQPRYL